MFENWDQFINDPNISLIKNKNFKFKRFKSTNIDDLMSDEDYEEINIVN